MSDLRNNNIPGVIIIEGHVQGLANTRSLGKAGIPVYVLDKSDCLARYSKYCKKFFICPDYKSPEFVPFLIQLAKNEQLIGWMLLPSNDHIVYSISLKIKEVKEFYKTLVPEEKVFNNIYNKANLLSLAETVGVPFPKIFFHKNYNDVSSELQYPVLTKGKAGLDFYKTFRKKVFLSHSQKELSKNLESIQQKFSLNDVFSQELIPFDGTNKTVSFTAFCIDGEVKAYWMGVKLREHPITFGTGTFSESVFESDCLEYASILLLKLNYSGICEVEFLKDPRDNKYKLIEINARTWLWVGNAIANGVNLPLYQYNFLNGISNSYPTSYKTGIKWRNPYPDIIFTTIALLKRKTTLRKVLNENKGTIVDALRDKEDNKPFYVYAKLLFGFYKKR